MRSIEIKSLCTSKSSVAAAAGHGTRRCSMLRYGRTALICSISQIQDRTQLPHAHAVSCITPTCTTGKAYGQASVSHTLPGGVYSSNANNILGCDRASICMQ